MGVYLKLLCLISMLCMLAKGFQFPSKFSLSPSTMKRSNLPSLLHHQSYRLDKLHMSNFQEPELTTYSFTPKRLIYTILWLGLVVYAFGIAPGGNIEAAAKDTQLITTILSTPFDGSVSPLFVAVFNALGILPAVFASLLLPGGKGQRVPAFPFVFSSFFLGFFGIGPYLFLREEKPKVSYEQRGFGTAAFEPKLASLCLLGFTLYLAYYALTASPLTESISSYLQLFSSQRLVHVSTIDFTILSLAVWDPLSEDMQRRNWKGVPAAAFCVVPVLGPVLYCLLRPALQSETSY